MEFADRGPFSAIVMSQVSSTRWTRWTGSNVPPRVLSPKGVLAVAVPNFGGIYSFLGARDPFLIPPVHLNFFYTKIAQSRVREIRALAPLRITTSRSDSPFRSRASGRRPNAGWSAGCGISHRFP